MVEDDPTKGHEAGLPVPANPQAGDEAETGQFGTQWLASDLARADSDEGDLTPESIVNDLVASTELDNPVPGDSSVESVPSEGRGDSQLIDAEQTVGGGQVEVDETAKTDAEPAESDVGHGADEGGEGGEAPAVKDWYILKVQVNREDSIRAALLRRIKIEGLEELFDEIVVPTEDVAEFNKSGKRKIVRRKLYPGYILVHMVVNDDTWFLVRETPGVGDFTGSSGKPTPMNARDVERILRLGVAQEDRGGQIKTAIPFKVSDRVRVKDGHFQNFEGEVDSIDEANGRITVMINIFNRSTPVELEHWQVESV